MSDNEDQKTDVADVVVWGAVDIAAVINVKPKEAFYLLERGLLPARKVGKNWAASRRKLLAAVVGE